MIKFLWNSSLRNMFLRWLVVITAKMGNRNVGFVLYSLTSPYWPCLNDMNFSTTYAKSQPWRSCIFARLSFIKQRQHQKSSWTVIIFIIISSMITCIFVLIRSPLPLLSFTAIVTDHQKSPRNPLVHILFPAYLGLFLHLSLTNVVSAGQSGNSLTQCRFLLQMTHIVFKVYLQFFG